MLMLPLFFVFLALYVITGNALAAMFFMFIGMPLIFLLYFFLAVIEAIFKKR